MKVRALKLLNYKGRTVQKDEEIELEDEDAAKKLIEVKAVEEVKEAVVPVAGAEVKKAIENKSGDAK